jgi:hypothetical protein
MRVVVAGGPRRRMVVRRDECAREGMCAGVREGVREPCARHARAMRRARDARGISRGSQRRCCAMRDMHALSCALDFAVRACTQRSRWHECAVLAPTADKPSPRSAHGGQEKVVPQQQLEPVFVVLGARRRA